jgi:hypothetical protein
MPVFNHLVPELNLRVQSAEPQIQITGCKIMQNVTPTLLQTKNLKAKEKLKKPNRVAQK